MKIKSYDIKYEVIKSVLNDHVKYQLMAWLSIKGAAFSSGLSETTIRRAIKSGTLKANKVGGKWIIKSKWLEKYLTN